MTNGNELPMTNMTSFQALIFDMDGLMVDSEPLWFEVQRDFALARGGEWTSALADRCVGKGLANTIRVMEQALGFAVDVDRDAAAIVDAFIGRVGTLALKRGCGDIVDAVGRHPTRLPRAVASSSARRLVEATLGRFGLVDRFDALVCGDSVARPKPAPDIFLLAASRLGVSPAACVVLEDSVAGVEAARAAGMRVVAVPERPDERFAVADAVVADLHEARELLGLL
ncbi:MAG: HAD family hydrolase [Polyangiaceae bacterium]|jgi:mannitol-1-/sugar-/sorbitol-6-/2-deoxyglucose-6-phosphatase